MDTNNEQIIDNIIYKQECFWRPNIKSKMVDSNKKKYPYPNEEPVQNGWSNSINFIDKLVEVQNYLESTNNSNIFEVECKGCLLCNVNCVRTKMYVIDLDANTDTDTNTNTNTKTKYVWYDELVHYIQVHNIKPSEEFIELIYNLETNSKVPLVITGRVRTKQNIKYIKIKTNQLMILDALMVSGGYTKKYIDNSDELGKKTIYKYSEHAGLLDIKDNGLEKVIVSGNTSRIDRGDEEIFLPNDLPEIFEYEYIFHTHPPTPKPGGRVVDGILYELPSTGDVFHFIEHFNMGKTVGSLIMTSEGLYNIRKNTLDKTKIKIQDENAFYKEIKRTMKQIQKTGIHKYGVKFNAKYFYGKIAQDMFYIDEMNQVLNKYSLHLDFFPRKSDGKNKWIVSNIYLPIY